VPRFGNPATQSSSNSYSYFPSSQEISQIFSPITLSVLQVEIVIGQTIRDFPPRFDSTLSFFVTYIFFFYFQATLQSNGNESLSWDLIEEHKRGGPQNVRISLYVL